MKSLLGLSLSLNLALGMMLFFNTQKKQPVMESRRISESSVRPQVETVETRGHLVDEMPKAKKKAKSKSNVGFKNDGMYEYEDADDKIKNDKSVYLTDTLGVTQNEIDKIEKIKLDYQSELVKVASTRPVFLPNLKEKKKMIELEEARNAKIEKVLGKSKYAQYMKYIENYNEEAMKRHTEDGGVIIPMDL